MLCPFCDANKDKVIDSRSAEQGAVIRRRRECLNCNRRFTTYERIEKSGRLMVIKKDGTRDPFSREKIASGVHAACGKRPIPETEVSAIIDEVEEELHRTYDREVDSTAIGGVPTRYSASHRVDARTAVLARDPVRCPVGQRAFRTTA